jgi:hypothetical protein
VASILGLDWNERRLVNCDQGNNCEKEGKVQGNIGLVSNCEKDTSRPLSTRARRNLHEC